MFRIITSSQIDLSFIDLESNISKLISEFKNKNESFGCVFDVGNSIPIEDLKIIFKEIYSFCLILKNLSVERIIIFFEVHEKSDKIKFYLSEAFGSENFFPDINFYGSDSLEYKDVDFNDDTYYRKENIEKELEYIDQPFNTPLSSYLESQYDLFCMIELKEMFDEKFNPNQELKSILLSQHTYFLKYDFKRRIYEEQESALILKMNEEKMKDWELSNFDYSDSEGYDTDWKHFNDDLDWDQQDPRFWNQF